MLKAPEKTPRLQVSFAHKNGWIGIFSCSIMVHVPQIRIAYHQTVGYPNLRHENSVS